MTKTVRFLIGFFLFAQAAFPSLLDMKKENPIVVDDKLRLSVLNEGCMRIEVGGYNDLPTYMIPKRDFSFSDFTITGDDNEIVVETKLCRFRCKTAALKKGERVRTADWKLVNCTMYAWRTNSPPNSLIFSGALPTIDFLGGSARLPKGMLSRAGFTVIEDRSPFIDGDRIIPRSSRPDMHEYYFLSYGTNYCGGLECFMDVSGRSPLPPRFSMGSWYSKWKAYSSKDYREIAANYEEHGFPLDVMPWDVDWHRKDAKTGNKWAGSINWTGWSVNRELLPDAEALISELKAKNIHVIPNIHPHDGIRSNEDCYPAFMEAMGESTNDNRTLELDLANPKYVRNYFKYAHGELEKAGVDYWWIDWQQNQFYPYVKGVPGLQHIPWLDKIYYEHSRTNGLRGMSVNRWGGLGSQRYPIFLSGDAYATWPMLAFLVPYTALAANSGCFFLAHDLGGFYGYENPELQVRWLQFGATTFAMRLHSDGRLNHLPWHYKEPYLSMVKSAYRLRAELLPYVYTCAKDASRKCRPIIRPMYYGWPNEEAAYGNPGQYMIGDKFMAAPIVSEGKGDDKIGFQTMWFPEEGWYNYFTGETFGKGERYLSADLHEFPLFLKEGVPMPLGRLGKNLAELPKEMDVMLFPMEKEGRGEFVLYEDDGTTEDYMNGLFAETRFEYVRSGEEHELRISKPEGLFKGIPERSFNIVVRNAEKMHEVSFNSETIDYDLNNDTHTCTIKLPKGMVGRIRFKMTHVSAESLRLESAERRAKNLQGEDKFKALGIALFEKDESESYLPIKHVHKFYPGGYCKSFTLENESFSSKVNPYNQDDPIVLPFPSPGQTNVVKNIRADLPGFIEEDIGKSVFYLKRMKRAY